jgi:predicted ATP-dependent endonuclease of OLD family
MHLQRVQVPDFRVLKDVDITFEHNFNPRVFPLGSQNGGGKSTLLQLIFVLLHCSANPERLLALKNLLSGFDLIDNQDKRILAIIDIWDGEKVVQLEFFICRDSYINQILRGFSKDKKENNLSFSIFTELKTTQQDISHSLKESKKLQDSIKKIQETYPELLDPNYISINQSKNTSISSIKTNIQKQISNFGIDFDGSSGFEGINV